MRERENEKIHGLFWFQIIYPFSKFYLISQKLTMSTNLWCSETFIDALKAMHAGVKAYCRAFYELRQKYKAFFRKIKQF